ncbi:NAD(P)/FAD-dependent oxidoreductase [Sulfitobacter sp. S190]|uniref:flavin monoamine oxidase family protein n=1 Tax=Sulfitobacter sp. S190 TaxID=2867022 RepID=UPI0021A72CDC|nr:NAD(P)/FAD-dependent oxidoreductase [Sulfitobacter sp. S190]
MGVLVIGGGLSGLAVADALHRAGRPFMLVEARQRLGGRIASVSVDGATFDTGPAWFWDGQPRIAALINRFGLHRFQQHAAGLTVLEDASGQVQHLSGMSPMQGSWRMEGGLTTLTQALAQGLPAETIRIDARVTALCQTDNGISATLADGTNLSAQKVVLCLPPRIAAHLHFTPALPAAAVQALQGIPTWMAGQAKVVAVYERPFWRKAGLSGTAMSRHGPMVEMHDASPADGGPYAIFGFVGVPPEHRRDRAALQRQVIAQLGRIFGPDALSPLDVTIMDWATEPCTATPSDHRPLAAHPSYGMPPELRDLWDGRLVLAGTEVATGFGGFIEGALEAAEDAVWRMNISHQT